jgi:hypothetical protein
VRTIAKLHASAQLPALVSLRVVSRPYRLRAIDCAILPALRANSCPISCTLCVRAIHAALQLFCIASIARDMSQNASDNYAIDNAAKIPHLPA